MAEKVLPPVAPIKLDKISFAYQKKEVLDDISMAIQPGTFTIIIGPNGAGKSTLLKCANQLLKKYQGDISMGQTNLQTLSYQDLSRYIGYVPQNYQTLFSMSVFDSILLGLKKKSTFSYSQKELEKVSLLLEQLELSEMASRPINHLSGGQQQRVTIARALVKDPPFLFMDEPTSGLDIKTQRDVMFFLKKLTQSKNIGVLTIVHDINLAAELADTIVILKEGKMLAQGQPKDVIRPDIIKDAFEVDNKIISHQNKPHMLINDKNWLN